MAQLQPAFPETLVGSSPGLTQDFSLSLLPVKFLLVSHCTFRLWFGLLVYQNRGLFLNFSGSFFESFSLSISGFSVSPRIPGSSHRYRLLLSFKIWLFHLDQAQFCPRHVCPGHWKCLYSCFPALVCVFVFPNGLLLQVQLVSKSLEQAPRMLPGRTGFFIQYPTSDPESSKGKEMNLCFLLLMGEEG